MIVCHHCGKELGTHTLDLAFSLPDVVWALSAKQRNRRTKFNKDLCVLDGTRFFIRGVAFVPVVRADEHFRWGIWAEVGPAVFERYLQLYKVDAHGEPAAPGRVANTPVGYPSLDGHAIDIAFGPARERPRMTLHPSTHPLSMEQHGGITMNRVHEINAAVNRRRS